MKTNKINECYFKLLNDNIEKNKNKRIAFWGASLVLKDFLNVYNLEKYNIIGIIDKNIEKEGQKLKNFTIFSPEKIKELNLDRIIFVIKHNSHIRYKEVLEYLKNNNLNIPVDEVFNLNDIYAYYESSSFDKKFAIGNALIYIPDYPIDYIQRLIVETNDFYEIRDLKYLDNYLNNESVILDIGANIGNHTVYWGKNTNVKKIHAFEPIKSTYEKLKTNIEINHLEDKVQIYNSGVGKNNSKANIEIFNLENTGATTIALSEDGEIEIISIDSLNIQDKISFIKIDTEGFELEVLHGAVETIKKYKPICYVEIDAKNLVEVEAFFKKHNYRKEKQVKDTNYLYIPNK